MNRVTVILHNFNTGKDMHHFFTLEEFDRYVQDWLHHDIELGYQITVIPSKG
jgi:hypothetical protein